MVDDDFHDNFLKGGNSRSIVIDFVKQIVCIGVCDPNLTVFFTVIWLFQSA